MAEETVVNGVVPSEEQERGIEIERQNEDEKIKLLMDEIEGLKMDRLEMKKRLADKQNEIAQAEEDKKALQAISSHASQLEMEVSRLQHDLISTVSENEDLGKELKEMKTKFEDLKLSFEDKELEIESLEKEKAKMEKEKEDFLNSVLETAGEVEKKEVEIGRLNGVIKEMQDENASLKETASKMAEIEDKYNEVRKQWEELNQEKLVNGNGNGNDTDSVVGNGENEKLGLKGLKGFKDQWPAALATTGTVAVAAVAVYVIYARRR